MWCRVAGLVNGWCDPVDGVVFLRFFLPGTSVTKESPYLPLAPWRRFIRCVARAVEACNVVPWPGQPQSSFRSMKRRWLDVQLFGEDSRPLRLMYAERTILSTPVEWCCCPGESGAAWIKGCRASFGQQYHSRFHVVAGPVVGEPSNMVGETLAVPRFASLLRNTG